MSEIFLFSPSLSLVEQNCHTSHYYTNTHSSVLSFTLLSPHFQFRYYHWWSKCLMVVCYCPFQASLFKMSTSPSTNGSDLTRKLPQMERLTEKTTRMLLAVLIIFVVVELPQSVLTLLTAVHGLEFFKWVV